MSRPNNKQHPAGKNENRGPRNSKNRKKGYYKTKKRSKNKEQEIDSSTLNSIDEVILKRQNLLEQCLTSRKKLFESFGKSDKRQQNKLQTNYFSLKEKLKKFEENINPKYQSEFKEIREHTNSLDTIYSTNHDISPSHSTLISDEEIQDVHLLAAQINSDFSQDQEETSGTMEDYLSYKETKKA